MDLSKPQKFAEDVLCSCNFSRMLRHLTVVLSKVFCPRTQQCLHPGLRPGSLSLKLRLTDHEAAAPPQQHTESDNKAIFFITSWQPCNMD